MRGSLSYTRRYYEEYLKKLDKELTVERLYLYNEELKPMSWEDIKRREQLIKAGKKDEAIFSYANQFAATDEILIAAPYWDLSFPSLLRVYLEKIVVVGITFGYEGSNCVGYCKANRIRYFSSCGGYVNKHLGAEYIRHLGSMLGINEVKEYILTGMDIDPSKRETLFNQAIALL